MKFKKHYGQNFLRSKRFVERIVQILDLSSNDLVFEIGPGDGFLTTELLHTEAKVVSIEIDYDLLSGLIKKFSNRDNFFLEHGDFLNIDLDAIFDKYYCANKKIKFVGSLPYNVSKKIIQKILEWNYINKLNRVDRCVFVVQEEVAKSYCAKPPKATILSTISSFYGNFRKYESIPAHCFVPKPKVNGAIVGIDFENIEVLTEEVLNKILNLIKVAYRNPNKMLKNSLGSLLVDKLSNEASLYLSKRPVHLSKFDWMSLECQTKYFKNIFKRN